LTLLVNNPTKNISGAIIPCHNPDQKPAGLALGSLNFEFGPAIQSMFADFFLAIGLF
jgi:hypothetical protein